MTTPWKKKKSSDINSEEQEKHIFNHSDPSQKPGPGNRRQGLKRRFEKCTETPGKQMCSFACMVYRST
jgi:hypothetical protein